MMSRTFTDHDIQPALEQNILDCFGVSSEMQRQTGTEWFMKAHNLAQDMSNASGYSLVQVVGVIAALSPRVRWNQNLLYASQILADNKAYLPVLQHSRSKARRILAGEHPLDVLNGPKTRAFFKCILNPEDIHTVCVDIWVFRVAIGDTSLRHRGNFSNLDYHRISVAFRTVADKLHMKPLQLQAICWVTIRQLAHMQPIYN